jgi:hypothetical protein
MTEPSVVSVLVAAVLELLRMMTFPAISSLVSELPVMTVRAFVEKTSKAPPLMSRLPLLVDTSTLLTRIVPLVDSRVMFPLLAMPDRMSSPALPAIR